MGTLEGKRAVVTGCAGGLGAPIVRRFCRTSPDHGDRAGMTSPANMRIERWVSSLLIPG
jgi:NAD(P)-dependent dehydrogenase (short-subunit alcohol dehydrogenase family)